MRSTNNKGTFIVKHPLSKSMAGFTLLEIMVVVVIIGILMALILPSYQDSVRKSRRSDAMSAILDVANRLEQYMLDNNAYTNDMKELGFANDPMVSPEGHYNVDATTGTNSYTITATAKADNVQINDTKCRSFSLTSTGVKSALDSGGTVSVQCWGL